MHGADVTQIVEPGAFAASRVRNPTLQEQVTKHAGHGPEVEGPSLGRREEDRLGCARFETRGILA